MKLLVAGAALVLVATSAPAVGGAQVEDPLVRARRAAAEVSFVGEVELRWNDAAGSHAESLGVRGAGGSVEVTGTNTVMAGDRARLVRHREGDWDLLWSGSSASVARPDPSTKYQTTEVGGTTAASRPANLLEVRHRGSLVQRLAVDDATGVLLRKEQIGPRGETVRSVAFTTFEVTDTTSTLRLPVGRTGRAAKSVRPDDLPSRFVAPERLADGYSRIGIHREDGVVHVLYSDGLYDLSLFEQRGRLVGDDIPAGGQRVTVGGRPGWVYGWQGGHVLLWHGGRTVYTLVSDGPVDQLVQAAGSLPVKSPRPSLLHRLRRVAASLVTG